MQHNIEPDAYFAVIFEGTILGVSPYSAEDARQDAIAVGRGPELRAHIRGATLTRDPDMSLCGRAIVAEMTEPAFALFYNTDGEICEGYIVRDGLVDIGELVKVAA